MQTPRLNVAYTLCVCKILRIRHGNDACAQIFTFTHRNALPLNISLNSHKLQHVYTLKSNFKFKDTLIPSVLFFGLFALSKSQLSSIRVCFYKYYIYICTYSFLLLIFFAKPSCLLSLKCIRRFMASQKQHLRNLQHTFS